MLKDLLASVVNWATHTGIKIIIALVIMWVSFKLINWLSKKIIKNSEEKKMDKTVVKTLVHVAAIAAKCIVVVCLIGYLGIDTSAITALIASFGVCIGLAVNGALSNIAGGVLILVTRPFKVDDFIEAQGVSGTVTDINMTATRVVTPDNKVVYLPNGALSSGNITNYSEKDTRRVDITFNIAASSDANKAIEVVKGVLSAHALIMQDPAPFVRLNENGDSCLRITSRAWVKSGDYWTVYFDVLESVKSEFGKNGISAPHNQVDVHIQNK
ncbi:MAG: mechanosensitive ion channel family protein [Ruminococcaceae bacterium]|nr:mechanosensitive ion channel family protein [Oscillospiraceae bacterium]